MAWCIQCAADKKTIKKATEIHFGRGYCEEHSKGWHPEMIKADNDPYLRCNPDCYKGGAMKPNPCKWCRKNIEFTEGCGYMCLTGGCKNSIRFVDFDTWQNNNPLPHQFKVGDWVKIKDNELGQRGVLVGSKHRIEWVGAIGMRLENCEYIWHEDQLEPATRLKRKEIRKVLRRLLEETVDGGDIDAVEDGLNKLIEEI